MRQGRNLTASEKKAFSKFTMNRHDPSDYLVEKSIDDKSGTVMTLRHKTTDNRIEITVPK